MSASLVGSEMCIRDRPWDAPDCETIALPTRRGSSRTKWTNCTQSHNTDAVSYTHLTLPTICSV
eukprot:2801165-Alexandrium_andersonii.AAC.1